MKTLADLKEGQKGIITKVKGRGAFRKRIIEMGFIVGKPVIVVKNAPLRDPIEYNIMGYEVSLRRSEASLIEIVNGNDLQLINASPYHGVQALEQTLKLKPPAKSKTISVALVGNPNSGKTTLFNFASHSKERVANYSGVTIDAKMATFKQNDYTFNLVDLPGTYSITSYTPEELYVRNHIFDELPDVVLNVVDASNVERNLYLTTQLIDMDIKVVVALNMYDEFLEKGDQFDFEHLSRMLGMPIVPTVASKNKGITALFERIIQVYEDEDPDVRHIHINYGMEIEDGIKRIQQLLNIEGNQPLINIVSPRYLAIKLMEGDEAEMTRIKTCVNYEQIKVEVEATQNKIRSVFEDDPETIITDAKYGFIEGSLKETFKAAVEPLKTKSRKIDHILTNKFLSYPIFVFIMWGIFQATFIIGDYPMQWIEQLMGWLGQLAYDNLPASMFRDLIVDGIIGGVGGVIVFLPNIMILFFFLSLLETTGYMARVAFIVDKLMHKVGLHGRSFIPLLMGFGCNVPAIMATRTIENRNDRLVTMMIIPFMSCSARYPVYILIISAFFDAYRGTLLFGIYMLGILFAGLLAWVFKRTLFQANEMPFVMELPPYRMPTTRAIFKQTWFKGGQYLKKMGTIILVASIIIWALGYFPVGQHIDREYEAKIATTKAEAAMIQATIPQPETQLNTSLVKETEQEILRLKFERDSKKQENSVIGRIGKFIEPAIQPLGFDWKMGVSLLAGSAAKEIVISTMGVIYQTGPDDEVSESLITKLKNDTYDYGPKIGEKVMRPLVALSFMIFVLIYFPCIAVFAAIKKESGAWRWPLFTSLYTTGIAWLAAFAVYQIGSLMGY
ncbi:MAG: ferrous iron transport protein B [Bacteroidetes bacterium]|nr:ferrous iron transport protein B [Bacteroidota bacterium]MBU1577882.1 ferrous iron transport protein B [Bacteroidota bacterium]MBU2465348.1 ferrous iron transport protein B [Bacteroidota bacterium]MBU2556841.1 ferrous iron transport protein B [Bacteroidota bacterium]